MERLVSSVFQRGKRRLEEVGQGDTATRGSGSEIRRVKSFTSRAALGLGWSLEKALKNLKTGRAPLFGVSWAKNTSLLNGVKPRLERKVHFSALLPRMRPRSRVFPCSHHKEPLVLNCQAFHTAQTAPLEWAKENSCGDGSLNRFWGGHRSPPHSLTPTL